MGVCITCKNPKYVFDMGYFGFNTLRREIANCIDSDFGNAYTDITLDDDDINKLIEEKNLEKYSDILNFLYMSDCDGSISYKTCGHIYELIKDCDFEGRGFRYGSIRHNDWEEFKEFLHDCYIKHKKMRWS